LIQVVDSNPSITLTGQLTDLTGLEKFELSDEQYALRQGVSQIRPSIVRVLMPCRLGPCIQTTPQSGPFR